MIDSIVNAVGGLFMAGGAAINDDEVNKSETNYVITGDYTNAGLYQNSVARLDKSTKEWTDYNPPWYKEALIAVGGILGGSSQLVGDIEQNAKQKKEAEKKGTLV